MALDIMSTLVELLCPTPPAQSACLNFINTPSHQVMQPLGPLLYFLFFPTVFLILLIYIGSNTVLGSETSSHKGLRLLMAVAVLIFIIIQGWYPVALWLGSLWFIFLPLIFVFYFFIRHFKSGGGRGSMPSAGGIGGLLKKRAMNEITGQRKDVEKTLNNTLNSMDAMIKNIKNTSERKEIDDIYRAYAAMMPEVERLLDKLREMQAVAGFKLGGGYDKAMQRYTRISREMETAWKHKTKAAR